MYESWKMKHASRSVSILCLVAAAGLLRRGLRAVDQRAMFAGAQLHASAAAARKRVLQRPQLQAPCGGRRAVPLQCGEPALCA